MNIVKFVSMDRKIWQSDYLPAAMFSNWTLCPNFLFVLAFNTNIGAPLCDIILE